MDSVVIGVKKQWNFVNSLTAFRALSVICALPFMYLGYEQALFVLVVFAIVTDAEGFIARYTGTTTNLGRVFDPLADKLFTDTMLLAYVFTHGSSMVMLLLLCTLLYDIDNTIRRLRDIIDACCNRSAVEDSTPTTLLSKSKTCVLYTIVAVLYLPTSWMAVGSEEMFTLLFAGVALVLISWKHNRRELISRLF